MTRPRQLALVPADTDTYGPPPAPSAPITTSGRTEYTVTCPGLLCGATHRHTGPGPRRGPCGTTYTVKPAPPADTVEAVPSTIAIEPGAVSA